jgi:hypothetical protein
MATYNEIYNMRYHDSDFKNRVVVACVVAAKDIFNEDPGTTNHTNRLAWATKVIDGAPGQAERMLWGLVSDTTIQANGDASTDGQIQTAVNSLIDFFAGI